MKLKTNNYNLKTDAKASSSDLIRGSSKGFVLLFSLLVSSVILAAGLFVVRIIIRQIALASIQKDSQMAFFAADAGVECGRYLKEGSSSNYECNGSKLLRVDGTGSEYANSSMISNNDGTEYSFNTGRGTIVDPSGVAGTSIEVPKNCVKVVICTHRGLSDTRDCSEADATSGKVVARGYNVACDETTGQPMQGRVVERKLVYLYR